MLAGSNASLGGLTLTRGYSTSHGGAIRSDGDLTLEGVVLKENESALDGGAVYATGGGAVTVRGSVFEYNTSGDNGGGLTAINASVDLATTTFGHNTTGQGGGGLYFYENDASADAVVKVSRSTFHNNTSGNRGAGIFVASFAGVGGGDVLENVTVSGNIGDQGGAVWLRGNSSLDLDLVNATVVDNHTHNGAHLGGVWLVTSGGGHLDVRNSILVGNTHGASYNALDLHHRAISPGGTMTVTNTMFVRATGAFTGSGNLDLATAAEAGLTALGDHGGPTLTHALLSDSPAIDAGDDAFAAAYADDGDQRGSDRLVGTVDMGAFELAADEYFGTI